jgi:DNA-directed RNA polymerase specialized sigma24 family protein
MALASIDSSGELPPDPPSGLRLDDGGVEEGHRALLASPQMLAAIRKVARRRGVAFQDVEDVVQETVVLAMEAALPSDGEQARRYVLTVASHVALRQVHGRAASPPGLADDDVEGEDGADGRVVAQAVPFEDRDAIRLVVEHGESRSPRWFPIFLRAKLLGESTEEIAQVHGEAPGTVRRIWSEMYRDLGDYGRSLGIAVGVACLAAHVRLRGDGAVPGAAGGAAGGGRVGSQGQGGGGVHAQRVGGVLGRCGGRGGDGPGGRHAGVPEHAGHRGSPEARAVPRAGAEVGAGEAVAGAGARLVRGCTADEAATQK